MEQLAQYFLEIAQEDSGVFMLIYGISVALFLCFLAIVGLTRK